MVEPVSTATLPPVEAETAWRGLLPALQRLDQLLGAAIERAQDIYGPESATDQFRGLYISESEPARLLDRVPGEPLLYRHGGESSCASFALDTLAGTFALTPFDVDVVLIALGPELDRRYERLYAYLQDNVSLRTPSIDLALNLLCTDAVDRLDQRTRFGAEAPLVANRLLRLSPESPQASGLARGFKLEPQITSFLLGEFRLDADLAAHCTTIQDARPLDQLPLTHEFADALRGLTRSATAGNPVRLHFHGPDDAGRLNTAAGVAIALGRPLLALDLALARRAGDFVTGIRLFAQAVRLTNATPCLMNCDAVSGDSVELNLLAHEVAAWPGVTIAFSAGSLTLPGVELLPVAFGPLGFAERRRWWQIRLDQRGLPLSGEALDDLAGRLSLTAGQIDDAVADAWWRGQWRAAADGAIELQDGSPGVSIDDLYESACERSTTELATLAQRLRPRLRWHDIVLPEDARTQLEELCSRVSLRRHVLDDWGFGRRLSLGRGTNALFAGPPGTGKTMAAEIVASELKLDLCKIDLSGVVSKYIGETEKNLDRIFTAAQRANAILFFDEADALFGKRSEVRDSHDRYANIEISYLLQKMEEYDGVAILATNLRQNLDESFIRRLAFMIHFPFPDEESRAGIWRSVWPQETPLAADVSAESLARRFKLAGGNIKNIALAAAFLAADEGGVVTMSHLLRATRREYQKLGKAMTPDAEEALA